MGNHGESPKSLKNDETKSEGSARLKEQVGERAARPWRELSAIGCVGMMNLFQ